MKKILNLQTLFVMMLVVVIAILLGGTVQAAEGETSSNFVSHKNEEDIVDSSILQFYYDESISKEYALYQYYLNEDDKAVIYSANALAYKINGEPSYVIQGSVSVPASIDGHEVAEIAPNAFSECNGITEVVLVGGTMKIGDEAFRNCEALESVIFYADITEAGLGIFQDCTSLQHVAWPEEIPEIPARTFQGCTALESPIIPEGVTALGPNCFFGCTSLKNVDLPETLTSIGTSAFYDCDSLEHISIPENVHEIQGSTFADCASLKEVIFKKSIEKIAENAFFNPNPELRILGFNGTAAQLVAAQNNIVFQSMDVLYLEDAVQTTLKDEENNIQVSAKLDPNATLVITPIEKTSELYGDLVVDLKNHIILQACDVSVTGGYVGEIQVTFDVDSEYNGEVLTVLHKKSDTTIEKLQNTVVDGKLTVTVTELSPFMVAVNNENATENENNNQENNQTNQENSSDAKDETPKTGVTNITVIAVLGTILSILGLTIVAKKSN